MTDRPTASTITDTQLDALYERVAKAEQEADAAVAAAAHLTTLVGKRSERAERAAEKQRRRADIAETELHVLRSGLRANGADPTQIQNLWAQIRLRNRQWREGKQRAEQAEATIARVRALAEEYPAGIDTALIHAALDDTQPPGAHVYLSTGCYHDDHAYCQSMTGLNGAKRPASCKFCHAPCRCSCHVQRPA